MQTLAANVDCVLVVHGLDRPVNRRRLERELVLAWDSGARPVVVLTKADLAGDVEAAVRSAEEVALGVDVVAVSATDGGGLERLRALVGAGRTFVLVGASGTGKSTLVNALAGEERQATGAVRGGDRRGRHTTTAGELVVLADGAILIDTPGIRAVGLGADDEGLVATFADIEELAAACRFPDCAHDREPGCAVRDGVDAGPAGQLAPARARDRADGHRSGRLGAGGGQQAVAGADAVVQVDAAEAVVRRRNVRLRWRRRAAPCRRARIVDCSERS